MRKQTVVVVTGVLLTVAVMGSLQAVAGGDEASFSARLTGYKEIPTLSVRGSGRFSAEIASDESSVSFTLTYKDLTGPASAAHIHLGKPWVAGGVIAFLCGGGGQASCPTETSGTVTGIITAANVVGPEAQGIAPGEFEEFIRALRADVTYANVHTEAYPTGEIRGRIDD